MALSLAVASVAFTLPHKTVFYYRFNSGSVTNISNYTQLDVDTYPCSTGSTFCGIQTSSTSPTISDSNGDGIPETGGGVTSVDKKN